MKYNMKFKTSLCIVFEAAVLLKLHECTHEAHSRVALIQGVGTLLRVGAFLQDYHN